MAEHKARKRPKIVELAAAAPGPERLQQLHNTRHATARHESMPDPSSDWLARFDWVLDAPLGGTPADDKVLSQRCDTPRSVFVKAGWLGVFNRFWLDTLSAPVTVYIGNADLPLSSYAPAAQKTLAHPMVTALFCEQKDLDVSEIRGMPVGLHPATVTSAINAERRNLRSGTRDARRCTVMVAADEMPPGIDRLVRAPVDVTTVPTTADHYRQSVASHPFALVGWTRARDTSAVWEALALGTIPILPRTPITEPYAALPVVRIDALSEITEGNLAAWQRRCSGIFEAGDDYLRHEFWWAKVSATLATDKRAFLVLGPESHGTHLLADLLERAGCAGSGAELDWQGAGPQAADAAQPWDERLPWHEPTIVWRRSVPHLGQWPDIGRMVRRLQARGYDVVPLVVTRNGEAAARSQFERGHVRSLDAARNNIPTAYQHIFNHLSAAGVTPITASYEALSSDDGLARSQLLAQLNLPSVTEFPVWDGNRRRHTQTPEFDRVSPEAFPTAALPIAADDWEAFCRQRDRGYARMRSSTVVFCAIARDVADCVPVMATRIEATGSLFKDYRVVVVENDSKDTTAAALAAWQARNWRVEVHTEQRDTPAWGSVEDPARHAQLAEVRNRCLDLVNASHAGFDYAVVVDMDLVRGYSDEGVAHSFGEAAFDAVASNGLIVGRRPVGRNPPHYDTAALRPVHAEGEPRLRRGEAMVSVRSAFGGLCVYRMAAFLCGARYAGPECEHVAFHAGLIEAGFEQLLLNPSQVVLHSERET